MEAAACRGVEGVVLILDLLLLEGPEDADGAV